MSRWWKVGSGSSRSAGPLVATGQGESGPDLCRGSIVRTGKKVVYSGLGEWRDGYGRKYETDRGEARLDSVEWDDDVDEECFFFCL